MPYLPVFDKVAEHILSLKAAGVKHLQMSWTLGGYPTPMLRMASRMMSEDISVHDYIIEWLGAEHGDTVDRAQRLMSRAFGVFPFNIEVLYLLFTNTRLALKLFRGEPAISKFDWNFSAIHRSSPPFSTDVWFGPPWCSTTTSTCPWIGHLVSGLRHATCRTIHARFHFGSRPVVLNLAA